MLLISAAPLSAQSLKEVLESDTMARLHNSQSARGGKSANKDEKIPFSNYQSLWRDDKAPLLLLNWIGIRIPSFKVSLHTMRLLKEYAYVRVNLTNREQVETTISILVPSPTYMTMAEFKTLSAFNSFRPPALDVVAEQTIPIQGLEAKYYRARNGNCSLLFNINKLGIVNLRTERCADSNVMISIAKLLSFDRLNEKLDS